MKIKLISLLMIFSFATTLMAQLPKDESGKVMYSNIVELDGLTKQEIYEKTKFWVMSNLKSGDNMTQFDEEKFDQIIGTGNLILQVDNKDKKIKKMKLKEGFLNFKFIVFIKDGKLKYQVGNLNLSFSRMILHQLYPEITTGLDNISDAPNFSKKWQVRYKEYVAKLVDENVKAFMADFEKSMKITEDKEW